jgi:hypothetical protein
MNYTYIEQLLERYWQGETNLDEEQILKSFFCQEGVPDHLREYAEFFSCVKDSKKMTVSDDFDSRFADILSEEEGSKTERMKAIRIPFKTRLMPFLKSAAVVAITLTIGGAAMRAVMEPEEPSTIEMMTGTYVQQQDVKTVIEAAQRSMTAKADSIIDKKAVDAEVKTE